MAYNANGYGYSTYREIGVKTASQGKLIVMLYQAAVNNLGEAISMMDDTGKIEACNIEGFGSRVQKAEDIITELEMSLNMDMGEISQNLMSLYVYFNKVLLESSFKHDKKMLSFVYKELNELKDSWEVIASSNANTQPQIPVDNAVVNITG